MLKTIWQHRREILEGLTNSVFIKEEVEHIADMRDAICKSCESYDSIGDGCEVPFTQPCCDIRNGGCGCSLHLKQRSLSSDCPKGYWPAILNDDEETKLNDKI